MREQKSNEKENKINKKFKKKQISSYLVFQFKGFADRVVRRKDKGVRLEIKVIALD